MDYQLVQILEKKIEVAGKYVQKMAKNVLWK